MGTEVSSPKPFELLPFRFRRGNGQVLLVNEVGDRCSVSDEDFSRLLGFSLEPEEEVFQNLLGKLIIRLPGDSTPVELLATRIRTRQAHLGWLTGLHIFVITLRCDHSCSYCQVSRVSADKRQFDMSRETAFRAVDLMFKSPSPVLKVEFQGGEPLLNFPLIREVVIYASGKNRYERRDLEFVITTNLAPLTQEILEFCKDWNIPLSTSLDGDEHLHNQNRPNGSNTSHQVFVKNLAWAREVLGHDMVAALMTTSQRSLLAPEAIVEEYHRLGFGDIFIRAMSPYGFANRGRQAASIQANEFLTFFKRALARVIQLNRQGFPMIECYSQILLSKIVAPTPTGFVNLCSPAGPGLAGIVYNYDGGVYPEDEARMLKEMGDDLFRMGSVFDSFESLYRSEAMEALAYGGCNQCLPVCADCLYQPYCGADPIHHHATHGDVIGYRPESLFCQRTIGAIDHLLGLMNSGDSFLTDLLGSWAFGRRPIILEGE